MPVLFEARVDRGSLNRIRDGDRLRVAAVLHDTAMAEPGVLANALDPRRGRRRDLTAGQFSPAEGAVRLGLTLCPDAHRVVHRAGTKDLAPT